MEIYLDDTVLITLSKIDCCFSAGLCYRCPCRQWWHWAPQCSWRPIWTGDLLCLVFALLNFEDFDLIFKRPQSLAWLTFRWYLCHGSNSPVKKNLMWKLGHNCRSCKQPYITLKVILKWPSLTWMWHVCRWVVLMLSTIQRQLTRVITEVSNRPQLLLPHENYSWRVKLDETLHAHNSPIALKSAPEAYLNTALWHNLNAWTTLYL